MLSFRAGTSKNKKYQSARLNMEATTSLYSMIQCCQMYQIFCFYLVYCNQKEKDIKRERNSKNKNIYV